MTALAAEPSTLRPGESTTWTASVHHPDGPQATVSGTLRDAAGQVYGAFEPGAAGDFVLTLSWAQIHAIAPIQTPAGGGARTFTATFEDAAGRQGSATFDLALRCPASHDAVCDGSCADLQSSPLHCGACGEAERGDLQCVDGELACTDGRTRCGDTCRDDFQACGGCGLNCQDYVDAAWANGLGPRDQACRSNRCYFVASRYWYSTDTPTESCAQICGRAGMECTQRTDINAVGTQHHNHLSSPLQDCTTKASTFWPDPNDPNLSYGLTRVDCGCQSPL